MQSYGLGLNIPLRWSIIQGDHAFFVITKRVHNGLHNSDGDLGVLGVDEKEYYCELSSQNMATLKSLVRSGDVVILHDPQTADQSCAHLMLAGPTVYGVQDDPEEALAYECLTAWHCLETRHLGEYARLIKELVLSSSDFKGTVLAL